MQAEQTISSTTKLNKIDHNAVYFQTFTMPLRHREASSSLFPIEGPACSYTYIMHAWNLLHLDKQGNVIKELSLDNWGTIWGKWIVKPNLFLAWVKGNTFEIKQWNIEANQSICVEIPDCWPGSIPRMYIFQETQLVCFVQKLEISQTITKIGITYFKYPLTSSEDKPIKVYEFERERWNRFSLPAKFNNHSGLIWHGYNSTFYVYDLRGEVDQIKQYKLHDLLGFSKDQLAQFSEAWQPIENKLFIKYSTKEQSHQIIYNTQSHKIQHRFQFKNNPIVQFIGSMRSVERYHEYDEYADRWPPVMNSMYYYIRIPVVYVQIGTWDVVAYEQFGSKHNHMQSKRVFYCQPEYDASLYLESIVIANQENKTRELRVMMTKIIPLPYSMSTIAVSLLEQLVSQWDEDLLNMTQSMIGSTFDMGEFEPKKKQARLLHENQRTVSS